MEGFNSNRLEHMVNHTCSSLHLCWFLSMNQVDYVSLGGVGIAILENKELIHSMFLESREVDKEIYGACQCFCNDKIFLPPDLTDCSTSDRYTKSDLCLTHAFEKIKQIFPRLCPQVLSFRGQRWAHLEGSTLTDRIQTPAMEA
jgi:hypothetical protein